MMQSMTTDEKVKPGFWRKEGRVVYSRRLKRRMIINEEKVDAQRFGIIAVMDRCR